jgi:hypothetical protein
MSVPFTVSELPDILNCIASGEYERAITLLQPHVAAPSKQQQRRRESSSSLVILYLYASIQCEQYDNLLQWAEHSSNSSLTNEESDSDAHVQRLLVAYAYYQRKQYAKVIALYKQQQLLSIHDFRLGKAWEHLYAQALYHLRSDLPRIVHVYDGILLPQHDNEMTEEYRVYTWTNLLAVFIAFFSVPYCLYIDPNDMRPKEVSDNDSVAVDDPVSRVQFSMQKHVLAIMDYIGSNSTEVSPDLVYNMASYLLPGITQQKQRRIWIERLQRAMDQVGETLTKEEDYLPQYLKDIVPVHLNYTLFDRFFWNATRRSNNGFTMFNQLSWTIRDLNAKHRQLLLPDDDATLLAMLPQQTRWVYRINQLLLSPTSATTNGAMISLLKEILSKEEHRHVLINAQLHILYYTLALYCFYDQQYVECQQLCQHYFLSTATTKSRKKKQAAVFTGTTPIAASYGSAAEQRFWECRATVLWAYCASSSDSADRSDRIAALDRFCQRNPDSSSLLSNVEDHVQVYAHVHFVALRAKEAPDSKWNDEAVAYNILQSLPPLLQSKPAIQSTMRRLQPSASTKGTGDSSVFEAENEFPTVRKVKDLVASIPSGNSETNQSSDEISNLIAYGDYAMSQSLYVDASLLYEAALSSVKRRPLKKHDPSLSQYIQSLTATYVCALTHVQPSAAISTWSSLSVPPLINEFNNSGSVQSGAELEQKEITFSTISPAHPTIAPSMPKDGAMASKEKRHAARLRRRARQRELYVQTLPPNSRNSAPHPDRWRPRYERRAAQGGGNADAGALDVVARQANRDAQVKSTAHMHVSGGKGGKNKKRR